jgi:nitroreductase
MDILDAIFTRRSIRKFKQQKISEKSVEVMLKAAMYAPSAANTQPWEFIVINKKHILYRIMEFHPYAKMLAETDTAILVCGDTHRQLADGYWPVDCAAATQNILLAAHGLGLGAVWLGIYPRKEREEETIRLFNLPSHIEPFSIVALGYPNEEKHDPDRFDEIKIHLNEW